MQELLVDFITSLDGYGAAEGWPGWWRLEGPEYLAWLGQQPERDYTILMEANIHRAGSYRQPRTSNTELADQRPNVVVSSPDPRTLPVASRASTRKTYRCGWSPRGGQGPP
jgi:hypothetical protein